MIQKNLLLRRILLLGVLLIFVPAMLFLTSCSGGSATLKATDLMKDIKGHTVQGKATDAVFVGNAAQLSLDFLKSASAAEENTFISPLSILLALSMTANGGQGETLEQMNTLLGNGLGEDIMNAYLYEYVKNLPNHDKAKLSIANSIWFRDDEDRLHVEEAFLQTNADFYDAGAYASPFNEDTVQDINQWVQDHTEGLIDQIIDQIDEDTIMYLVNAMVFDGEWATIYREEQLETGTFIKEDGTSQQGDYMTSEERIYLENDLGYGFIKPYAGQEYGFFALLPKEDRPLETLLSSLDGKTWLDLMEHSQDVLVRTKTPKFSFAYEWKMNDALKNLGMTDAFDADLADFSRLGQSSRGNIYVGEVLHKTFIQVDEKGTKAGAVTKVEIKDESYEEGKEVHLNRPFLFGIVDLETGLPLFIGTVTELPQS